MVKIKQNYVFVSAVFAALFIIFVASFAAAAVTIVSPITGFNATSRQLLFINITFVNLTDITFNNDGADHLNITIYMNSSGTGGNFVQVANLSYNGTSFAQGLNNTGNLTIVNSTTNFAAWGYINISNTALFQDNWTMINVSITNWSATVESANNKTFKIDSTVPLINSANITSPVTLYNYSNANTGYLLLNVSIHDARGLSKIETVFFNITNSTGAQHNSTILYASNPAGEYWNISINTSAWADGRYNITVWANDTGGNLNNTGAVLNFILDNTGPTGSVSCTPNPVNQDDTATCTCSASDSVAGLNSTSITASPSTSNTGTYNSVCTAYDIAGNIVTITGTYTVEGVGSSTGGSSGGSGGSTTTTPTIAAGSTVSVTETQVSSGYSANFNENSKISVSIKPSGATVSEAHTVAVTAITTNKVTITISSDPITLDLSTGETKKVDINNDGTYDLSVKLNSIANGKADVTVKKISESIGAGETGAVSNGTTEDEGTPETGAEGTSSTTLWTIVGIIAVIILIGLIAYLMKAKKGRR